MAWKATNLIMSNQDLILLKKVMGVLLNNVHLLAQLELDVKEIRGLYMKLIIKGKV